MFAPTNQLNNSTKAPHKQQQLFPPIPTDKLRAILSLEEELFPHKTHIEQRRRNFLLIKTPTALRTNIHVQVFQQQNGHIRTIPLLLR